MATIHPFVMLKTSKMNGHVPYRVKEELRRWNNHLEKHKKKISGARTTIEKKMKAVEMKDQLQRNSHYQSEQRALGIQHDNQLLLKKLDKIGRRDESMSRNVKYYDKRRPENGSRGTSPTGIMKSIREKEKKNIKDEKSRMESKINAEQKKQRNKQDKNDPNSGSSPATTREDVESIRPNVLPVKLEKDRKKNSNNSSSYQTKREKSRKAEQKEKNKVGETKTKKSTKNNETKTNKKANDPTQAEDIDGEIDRIIVHSTYDEDGKDNFQIDVVDGNKSGEENGDEGAQDVDDVINNFLKNIDEDETQASSKKSSPIPPIVIPRAEEERDDETSRTNDTARSETVDTAGRDDATKKDRKRKSSSGSSGSSSASNSTSDDSSSDNDSD